MDMYKIIIVIAFGLALVLMWALPLWAVVNLFAWALNLTFRITIWQAAVLGACLSVVTAYCRKTKIERID